MKQLTVRLTEPELQRRIEDLAAREHLSLNQAVLKLLRRAVGLGVDAAVDTPIGDDIEPFVGLWTDEEAEALSTETAVFERIDEDFWR